MVFPINIISIIIIGIFIVVVGLFIKAIYNSIVEKIYNDSQPILTKNAKISAKRTEMSGGSNTSVRTAYYATFEFAENKERLELEVYSEDYGLLAEGDSGKLTYQGSRYINFRESRENT